MTSFTFKKAEHLKSHTILTELFQTGQSFSSYPLRVVYLEMPLDSDFPCQFALSVPKKKFRRAVDRNRLRRRIREAYRLHKHELYEKLQPQDKQLALMIIYVAREEKSQKEIKDATRKILKRLGK